MMHISFSSIFQVLKLSNRLNLALRLEIIWPNSDAVVARALLRTVRRASGGSKRGTRKRKK